MIYQVIEFLMWLLKHFVYLNYLLTSHSVYIHYFHTYSTYYQDCNTLVTWAHDLHLWEFVNQPEVFPEYILRDHVNWTHNDICLVLAINLKKYNHILLLQHPLLSQWDQPLVQWSLPRTNALLTVNSKFNGLCLGDDYLTSIGITDTTSCFELSTSPNYLKNTTFWKPSHLLKPRVSKKLDNGQSPKEGDCVSESYTIIKALQSLIKFAWSLG